MTVIEESPFLAPQMAIPRRWRTLHVLRQHGAELLCSAHIEAFTEAGVELKTAGGETRLVKASQILIATGVTPNRELANALHGLSCEVHTIGDAETIGYIEGAMLSGAQLGRAL